MSEAELGTVAKQVRVNIHLAPLALEILAAPPDETLIPPQCFYQRPPVLPALPYATNLTTSIRL